MNYADENNVSRGTLDTVAETLKSSVADTSTVLGGEMERAASATVKGSECSRGGNHRFRRGNVCGCKEGC